MGGKKIQKLTAEEKKLLKEQKKLEKKLQEEEEKRKRKRNELQRELEYGERNRKKLEQTWKQMLMDIKIPELREQLELAIISAEYKLDMKDFTISLLLDQLDEAEEQYRMNMTSHSEDTRKIIEQFNEKLKDMRTAFELGLHNMLKSVQTDHRILEEQGKGELNEREMAINELEQEGPEVLKREFKTRMDSLEKKNLAELETQRGTLENRYEDLWNQYQSTLQTYLNNTAETRREYEALVRSEERHLRENKKLNAYVCVLREYLRISREAQLEEKQDYDRRIKCVREDIQNIHNSVRTGQGTLRAVLKLDQEQIVVVAQESNTVLKEIQELVEKEKKVLRWVSLCRKFETRDEQVFPFPKFESDTGNCEITVELDEDMKMLENVHKLKGFWIKYNKVELSLHRMKEERNELKHQNQRLKEQIAVYCSKSTLQCPKHVPIPKCSKSKL